MNRKLPKQKLKPLAAAVASATQGADAAKAEQQAVFTLNQALFAQVEGQRNELMNALAMANAKFAVATSAIHEQDRVIAELRAQVKAYETPGEAPKPGKPTAAAPH